MKKILILPVVIAIISVMFFSIQTVTAAGPIDLTGVGNFAVLSKTYTNSGTGVSLNGDLGYDVTPGNPPAVSGTIFAFPNTTYLSAIANQATILDMANDVAKTGSCTTTLSGVTVLDSLPQPLTPGVYCIGSATHINTAGITLSGNGVYIFRINGALDTIADSHVTLMGADANDVFWAPTGATTLGANSVFTGNILTNAAVTVGSTVTMNGRILSNGAVTMTGSATITSPHVTVTSPTVTITPPAVATMPSPSVSAIPNNNVITTPTLGLDRSVAGYGGRILSYGGNEDPSKSIFSSSYVVITPKVGVVNKAVFAIYEKDGSNEIRHIDLAFGLATGQVFSNTRIVIQWDKSLNGIETLTVIDPEHALTNVKVETSRGSCEAGVVKNDCLIVTLYHTFTYPLAFNVIATNLSDRISSLSYWSGYDRNDLIEFGQLKKDQALIATGIFDSSKIQTHMPILTDSIKYFAIDNRDTFKFENMKVKQALLATKLWDSSEIQNHDSLITDRIYMDSRDTMKFEQMKKDQALIATEFWDSSEIQNQNGASIKHSVSPASTHCFEDGGVIRIRGVGESMQSTCVFPNGFECEVGQYFRGQCSAKETS